MLLQRRIKTMTGSNVFRRLGVMFLLACVVSISTAGCLLVPVPVGGGGGHRHHGRW